MTQSCICIAMRTASRKLTSLYDEALAPCGVNIAQFSLLRKIRRRGPISLTALGEIVELDRSTLGRNVRVLERMGLVSLAPGADQREARVDLTEAGRTTLAVGDPLWDAVQDQITRKLGARAVEQLEALLGAL
jgi:DNA-binding MarR family transcriptional regulator